MRPIINKPLDIQGHRGARGLYPENTITAFIAAIDMGVNTIEMDVVISADNKVVVSHEAWMNAEFCSLPDGTFVDKNSELDYNFFKMTYAEIAAFDCGNRGNSYFPLQKTMPEHKPLLSAVIKSVETYIRDNKLLPVRYNIEIKTEPGAFVFNPDPFTFVALVYEEIKNILHKVNIQSFDISILQEMQRRDSAVKIGFLVENKDPYENNLQQLGFFPDVYSPEYILVNEQMVTEIHKKEMLLIPWTVNETEDIKRLLSYDVDGIISDYPNRVINLIRI